MAVPVVRPRVFLDFHIGTEPAGRVVFELFVDKAPKACENFRAICTASYTPSGATHPLSYKLSPLHRVIDEFMIQGGDITKGNGTGGDSIYGGEFKDENIGWREIDAEGLLCMANRGKDTNSSHFGDRFFITLAPCTHLNDKHTVFGHVVSGMPLLHEFAKVCVDSDDKPNEDIIVSHCGELERRKKQPTNMTKSSEMQGSNTPDRGRKKSNTDRKRSASPSSSSSGSISPPTKTRKSVRRRSDIEIDENRRGRTLTRSPSSTEGHTKRGTEIEPEGVSKRRRRGESPSRPSGSENGDGALRRPHARSKSRNEEERKRANQRHHDDDRYGRGGDDPRAGDRDNYPRQVRYQDRREDQAYGHGRSDRHDRPDRYNPRDSGRLDTLQEVKATGDVKFKGRGSMKYRD
ncbi:hypothetical protein MMC25_007469 [Agyrium rufum]|nr:hypothetical protein [Agyrium rufum]